MTQTRRLILNIIATSTRSIFMLVCGLLTGRWMLLALGEVDYGLFGLVGGLVFFISFFNTVFSESVVRFYAYSVGKAKQAPKEGLEDCRRWFNAALTIHTIVPLVFITIGYPLGVYAIRHWLNIPIERLSVCVWVFRYSCLSCFISMITVPFQAMYMAKQYLAELTVYSVAATVAHVVVLYYMVSQSGDWLLSMAIWLCIQRTVPILIIAIRSICLFPECRVVRAYLGDWNYIRKLTSFASWQFFVAFGKLLRAQGLAILVNKYFGARGNAAYAVSNSVSGHAQTLSNDLNFAFSPAITNACGANDWQLMLRLVNQCSKFSGLLILCIGVPLSLELKEVMQLWLKHPPLYSVEICFFILLSMFLEKITSGQEIAIKATGKVSIGLATNGIILILTVPFVLLCFVFNMNLLSIGYVFLVIAIINTLMRILIARFINHIPIRGWLRQAVFPLFCMMMVSVVIGAIPQFFFPPSFIRVVLTTFVSLAVILPGSWFVLMDAQERGWVHAKIRSFMQKIKGTSESEMTL